MKKTKAKTRKAITNRFKITKSGNILKRKIQQGHYKSKESGQESRAKRRLTKLAKSEYKTIKKYLAYRR